MSKERHRIVHDWTPGPTRFVVAKRSKQGAGGRYSWDLKSLLKKCWPTLLG